MAFLFRSKAKSEYARPARELFNRLWQQPASQKVDSQWSQSAQGEADEVSQTEEDLAKVLAQMKLVLQGTQGQGPRLVFCRTLTELEVNRDWEQSWASLAFGQRHSSWRSSIFPRAQYSFTTFWVTKRYPGDNFPTFCDISPPIVIRMNLRP